MKHAIIAVGMAIALASSSANAGVMVHMFGWKYNDIANECENVLGPKGYDGVEVSSPAEHVTGDGWWIAYQPVNYKNFTAIGGNESELKSLITRCHKAGIKVYADAVFNQLSDSSGTGSGGSSFGGGTYPAFSAKEFHTACTLSASSYKSSRSQVQTCRFGGLPDLDTGSVYVQGQIATYLKTLTSFGIDGFRIDAAKHISATDLSAILTQAGKPFVYQEVIYGGKDEVVQPEEYQNLGMVLESRFTGGGLDDGYPQVMSGYDFGTATMALAPSVTPCTTGSKWNCEQRWPQIANMVYFHNVTKSVTTVSNWWDNGNNQIAFGRGNKGFVVINNEGGSINQSFQTGLPAGEYCNIVAGDDYCSGSYVTVDASGKASVNLGGMKVAAIVADCTKGKCGGPIDNTFPSMNLRGTFNGWKNTPMTVDPTTRVWSAVVDFDGKPDSNGAARFKFDVFGNGIDTYGDVDGDGKADKGTAKNDIIFTAAGKYKVELKEGDLSYSVTQIIVNQAPKAVISPATITVKVGEQVVFDGAGSTDDVKVETYSWSTGGAGKTEAVSFNKVGKENVTLTVTDAEGLKSTATSEVTVKEEPQPGFISNFKQMSYRSTNNGWGVQAMELVADNTWQTTITLDGRKGQRFKLDVSDNLSEVFGDRNDDGKLDKSAVILLPSKGTFLLTVNDETMTYTLEKQGAAYASTLSKLYFTGTPNR